MWIDDRPWPHPCHRCGIWVDNEHSHVGHGFTMFCDECEDSYQKWFKSGETKELREMIDNNEVAREVLLQWIRDQKENNMMNYRCIKCNKRGDHYVWNTPVCNDHYNEFEKLKKDLKWVEF